MPFPYYGNSQNQEYVQQINVLKHGFTQREREAENELDSTISKTFALNVMKTIPLSYVGLLAYTGFKLSDAANIVKHLKSVHMGIHISAIGTGLVFAAVMIPDTEIVKRVLNKHHITTEDNLGKLVAMREEEKACSQLLVNVQKYTQNAKKNYSDDLLSLNKQIRNREPLDKDDGFENFYAKKHDRRTNTYGDELDSD